KPHVESSAQVPEGSGNLNPTVSLSNPPADQIETLTVESPIPTVKTPSLDNILSLTNRFEDILRVKTSSDEAIGVEADVSNMETTILASPTPTIRIHKDHPKSQIIGPVDTPIQTRHKSKEVEEQSFIATIYQKTDPALLQFCLFLCFLSQVEPKKVSDALQDPSWVEAMQEELLQFKIQKVWTLVDCLKGIRPIGIKWVLKNTKDERGIVVRIKARLVAQGHTQEEGIDYDEVFAPVARIEAIRLFLAYASFMGFTIYQIDVKSAFLYGTIDEEVYMMQHPGFQDPAFPARVYKVEKAMYGLHQAPRAWYGTLSKYLLKNGFQRGAIDQTLFRITKLLSSFLFLKIHLVLIIDLPSGRGTNLQTFNLANLSTSSCIALTQSASLKASAMLTGSIELSKHENKHEFASCPLAFPLPRESSHWQYKFPLAVKVVPTTRRLEMPLPGVCTAIEEMMKKLPVKDRWQ
nr:putative ribonuclease H-like domain-containing protein [Tanacetum cinerariifolium]